MCVCAYDCHTDSSCKLFMARLEEHERVGRERLFCARLHVGGLLRLAAFKIYKSASHVACDFSAHTLAKLCIRCTCYGVYRAKQCADTWHKSPLAFSLAHGSSAPGPARSVIWLRSWAISRTQSTVQSPPPARTQSRTSFYTYSIEATANATPTQIPMHYSPLPPSRNDDRLSNPQPISLAFD